MLQHELGVGLVVRRSDLVRLARHALHPFALVGGIERLIEALLERVLIARVRALNPSIADEGGSAAIVTEASRQVACKVVRASREAIARHFDEAMLRVSMGALLLRLLLAC